MSVAAASPSRRSAGERFADALARFCAAIPYALVALALRLVMARAFFLSGQTKIEGPQFPIEIKDFDVTFLVTLPVAIKDETFQLFASQYAALPLDPTVAAYLFSYTEFVLPICLVLGFATRIAALGLLAITALLQIYVLPGMWWAAHVYWAAILLVLLVCGPGMFSIDAVIRAIFRKS
ncbi:MAG: DoxX family protein [Hyphomicrobiales bacterium]|nr:DoxX family protein [Hyphomicrobiales bacterium]